jgi:hypothetical protein
MKLIAAGAMALAWTLQTATQRTPELSALPHQTPTPSQRLLRQQEERRMSDAPETIGLIQDDFLDGIWAIAHKSEAKRATLYRRADLPPTIAECLRNEKVKALVEAAQKLHHAVCDDTGFAFCVRADSGKAYPWPALDIADELVRAAIAALPEVKE